MNKKTFLSGVAAALCCVSISVQANSLIKAFTTFGSGAPLYTLHVTTPYDQEIVLDEVRAYLGMSQSNPCSDLVMVADEKSDGYQTFVEKSGSYAIQGDELNDIGAVISCVRFDTIYHGKTYSTGNIRLVYNNSTHKYTGAMPSSGTINYSK